jgi:hypothetical protein
MEGDRMLKEVQLQLQICIPIRGCGHIRFGPSRAGKISERFTGVPRENHERVTRRIKSLCVLAWVRHKAGGDSARGRILGRIPN